MLRTLTIATFISLLSACHLYFDSDEEWVGPPLDCCEVGEICTDIQTPCENADSCRSDNDCTVACYCSGDGQCTPSDYCDRDSDCWGDFTCDKVRNTCVPGTGDTCQTLSDCPYGQTCDQGTCQPIDCTAHSDCPGGYYCDGKFGQCAPSWSCDSSTNCGSGLTCDDRDTCIPDACEADDECAGGAYCDLALGSCVDSGTCHNDVCGEPLVCEPNRDTCVPADHIRCDDYDASESDCFQVATCQAVYTGLNCTDPNGTPCTEGTANCTCEQFVFADCASL